MRVFAILVGLSLSCQALAEMHPGQTLFMEANCQKCHAKAQKFKPHDRQSKDFISLRGWVKGCSSTFGAAWFPEDYQDVTLWLNNSYYKYAVVELDE
jgi:hypothetical protein